MSPTNHNFSKDSGESDLKLTYLPWRNVHKGFSWVDTPYGQMLKPVWTKVMMARGPLTQYRYGTTTTSETPGIDLAWPPGEGIQVEQLGVVCAPHTGLIVIDVDDPDEYAKSNLAKKLPLELAYVRRGRGGHIYVDARNIPPDQWPSQGPIQGGDLKSNGFVAAAGSLHYSETYYEATGRGITR